MKPETFDNTEVFLSGAAIARDQAHMSFGAAGSSLLSIRTDLKTFSDTANPHSQGLSLEPRSGSCREQYVVRMAGHTLKVILTSYKPGEQMLYNVRKPDTALKIQQMAESIVRNIPFPYVRDLGIFLMAVFTRNSDTCQFTADSYDDEWTLVFSDPKNRTQVAIELIPSELIAITRTSPLAKARAKGRKAPAEPAIA